MPSAVIGVPALFDDASLQPETALAVPLAKFQLSVLPPPAVVSEYVPR